MLKVAIGIPTYNQNGYISGAIKSALEQVYAHTTVLVSDDQSVDNTESIIINNYPTVQYHKQPDRLGRVKNYKNLLYKLSGDAQLYINLDGDDFFIDPKFVSIAVAHIEKLGLSNIAFYQGNHDLARVKKVFVTSKIIDNETVLVEGKDYFLNFHKLKHFTHCATIFNREKALQLKFYNYDALYNDFLSMAKLSLLGGVLLSSRKVAEWRSHGENASSKLNQIQLLKEFNGLEDVADFSKNFVGKHAASQWLQKMKEYFRMTLIYHNAVNSPNWKTFMYLLKHWKFSYFYFSALYHLIKAKVARTVKFK